jgi:hypothetical protein
MSKTYLIKLGDLDLFQLLDGLAIRAEAWEKTAYYLRFERFPDDNPILVEECSNPNEADAIANHYRSIIATIHKQMEAQE